MPAVHFPRKKTALLAAAIVLVLFVAWLLTAYQLFYNVQTQAPKKADAVVMLGGASSERLLDAMLLRAELDASYLVISHTNTPGNASADDYCNTHSNKAIYPDVICFTPHSMDTRGEAAALGDLAAEYHWKNVTVVTSIYHVQRAGTLMDQCINADVTMMSTAPQFSTWQWLRRFVIETGGILSVTVDPECQSPIS